MLNLSISALRKDHIDEFCEDIIEQQKTGATTHAMFMMKFNPECNPAPDKATKQCELYDIYREKLDKAGAKHGVLVQAIKAMREGLDEVDPSIQGIVSGIYVTTFVEFSGDAAKAFAGKGNPSIIRLNGGPYAMDSS